MKKKYGFSLIEMMVVLVIVSILAATAKPFIEVSIKRAKESELRKGLRDFRQAIDRFHQDCADKKFQNSLSLASNHCYPTEFDVLVDGVELVSDSEGSIRRYLRSIPRDPFVSIDIDTEDSWEIRGYLDDYDSSFWDGEDVYDIRVTHELQALDGSFYRDW